jgi:hypothetical protein
VRTLVRRRGAWLTTSTRITEPRPAIVAADRIKLAERAVASIRVQSSVTVKGVR